MRTQKSEVPGVSRSASFVAASALMREMTPAETTLFGECERTIEAGLDGFMRVYSAVKMIRDQRLYRWGYKSFEEYCARRWGKTSRRIRQICDAGQVVENLSGGPIVNHGSDLAKYEFSQKETKEPKGENVFDTILAPDATKRAPGATKEPHPATKAARSESVALPTNERQVRPLLNLAPDEQRQAWDEAREVAARESRPVTGKDVERAVEARVQPQKNAEVANVEPHRKEIEGALNKAWRCLMAAMPLMQKCQPKFLRLTPLLSKAVQSIEEFRNGWLELTEMQPALPLEKKAAPDNPYIPFRIGDIVKTNYGTTRYRIVKIEDKCRCANYVDQINNGGKAKRREPHLHFVVVHESVKPNRKGIYSESHFNYLNGYVYRDGECVDMDGPHAKGTQGWHKRDDGLDKIFLVRRDEPKPVKKGA